MAKPNVVKLIGVDSKNGEIIAVYISHELSGYKGKFVPDRQHGEWIEHRQFNPIGCFYSEYECSNCHDDVWQKTEWQFCPNCGADMREGEEK